MDETVFLEESGCSIDEIIANNQTCQQSSQASWVPQLGLIVECLYFSLA
jgi:hypothetical protein